MNFKQDEIDKVLKNYAYEEVHSHAKEKDNSAPPPASGKKSPLVEKVEFAPLEPRDASFAGKTRAEYFDDIQLVVSGELGGTEITVRELLKLEEGAVIKLDRIAGDSSSILVNEQHLGQAEVVVINDRFGLRITSLGHDAAKEDRTDNEPQEKKSEGHPGEKGGEEG